MTPNLTPLHSYTQGYPVHTWEPKWASGQFFTARTARQHPWEGLGGVGHAPNGALPSTEVVEGHVGLGGCRYLTSIVHGGDASYPNAL